MRGLLILLILLATPKPALAVATIPLLHEYREDGDAVDVVTAGSVGYVLKNDGLAILDITNDLAPVSLSFTSLSGLSPRGLVVAGSIAYVATFQGGVRIFDVSDPTQPALLATWPCTATHVRHDSGRLYVCAFTDGLIILDVTDPAAPVHLMTWTEPGVVRSIVDVATSSTHAWVGTTRSTWDASIAEIVALDVTSDPPVILDNYFPPNLEGTILALGPELYTATTYWGTFTSPAQINVFDAGNPNELTLLGQSNLTAVTNTLQFANGYLYGLTESGLRVFDVDPPNQPSQVQALDLYGINGGGGRGVVTDSRVYQAAGNRGVMVFSAANPANLSLAGFWDAPSMARDVVISGNYAYLMDRQLWTVDISNPAQPLIVSRLYVDATGGERVGNILYVAGFPGARLTVISLANPAQPALVSQSLGNGVLNLRAGNGWLYTIESSGPLRIYDLANPLQPVLHGSVALPARGRDLTIHGGYAYISGETTNLFIVNVTNPDAPTLVATVPGFFRDLDATGGVLYAARDAAGFQTFDLSNPAAPALLATLPGECVGLTLKPPMAYLANGLSGVSAVHIGNPSQPVVVGTSAGTSSPARDLAVEGNVAVVGLAFSVGFYDMTMAIADVRDGGGAVPAPLVAARPNPFVGSTRLRVEIPEGAGGPSGPANARMSIVDVSGRSLRSWELAESGAQFIDWDGTAADGRELGAGLYFLRLEAGGEVTVSRVVKLARE